MQLTKLEAGNIIVFDSKELCVFIRLGSPVEAHSKWKNVNYEKFENTEDDTDWHEMGCGIRLKWTNGDDKISVNFIQNEVDFWTLSTIIAETHGMKIEPCDNFMEHYGPAFRFVK